jgi:hypothetical protein
MSWASLLTEVVNLMMENDDGSKDISMDVDVHNQDISSASKDDESSGEDVLLFGEYTRSIGRKFY